MLNRDAPAYADALPIPNGIYVDNVISLNLYNKNKYIIAKALALAE